MTVVTLRPGEPVEKSVRDRARISLSSRLLKAGKDLCLAANLCNKHHRLALSFDRVCVLLRRRADTGTTEMRIRAGLSGHRVWPERDPHLQSPEAQVIAPPSQLHCSMSRTIYPPGAIIFTEGDTATHAFYIRSGRIKLSIVTSAGRAVVVRVAGAGETMGIASVVSNLHHQSTAETVALSTLDLIGAGELLKRVYSDGFTALWVARQIATEHTRTIAQVGHRILSGTLKERIAAFLAERTLLGQQEDVAAEIGTTHEEIAQLFGCSREAVTRTLAELRSQTRLNSRRSKVQCAARPKAETTAALSPDKTSA